MVLLRALLRPQPWLLLPPSLLLLLLLLPAVVPQVKQQRTSSVSCITHCKVQETNKLATYWTNVQDIVCSMPTCAFDFFPFFGFLMLQAAFHGLRAPAVILC
jgi:hypothetical protein